MPLLWKKPIRDEGFYDYEMVGDVDRRKFTGGYVYTIVGGVVSWCSRLQKVICLVHYRS